MQSKTLSSDSGASGAQTAVRGPNPWFSAALMRKNLSRFWPLWAVYAAIWLIMGPLVQFVALFGDSAQYYTPAELTQQSAQSLLSMGTSGGLVMAGIFGCLFAMALFSYLCSTRSVGMFHSFPIRREGLFLTNYASGLAVFVVTGAVTALSAAAVQGAAGVLVWGNVLRFFAAMEGQMLFFYSFACFCAMFTGQILAIPVFYVVLNGLAAGINLLIQNFAAMFFYGYAGGGTPDWVVWLTPLWKFINTLSVRSLYDDTGNNRIGVAVTGLGTVGVYALAGLAFAALALAIYRCRRSETAGDTVTVRCLRPVFRVGVAVCSALSLGQGLYFLVWQEFHASSQDYSLPAILLCMAIMGLVGYYAAQMMLRKSFRVFRRSWKGALALVLALAAFGIVVSKDLTGVERRVPAADAVESLDFGYGAASHIGGLVSDPAVIGKFEAVHRALIAEKDVQQERKKQEQIAADDASESDETLHYCWITLNYTLKSGSRIDRSYDIRYTDADLQNPDSAAALLAKLSTDPDVQLANLFQGQEPVSRITSAEINTYDRIYANGYDSGVISFDAADAQKLYDAVLADAADGNFGVNQFREELWGEETYANTLTIYYRGQSAREGTRQLNISFSVHSKNLLSALKASGAGEALYTQEELSREMEEDAADEESATENDAVKEKGQAAAAALTGQNVGVIGGADGPTEIVLAD